METIIYKSRPKAIKKAVLGHNLATEFGVSGDMSSGSGSVGYIKEGIEIEGGYVVKSGKNVVGWGSAYKLKEIHVYVKPSFRKRGIASKIIERAKKDFPDHCFCPWSKGTFDFFTKTGAKITRKYY